MPPPQSPTFAGSILDLNPAVVRHVIQPFLLDGPQGIGQKPAEQRRANLNTWKEARLVCRAWASEGFVPLPLWLSNRDKPRVECKLTRFIKSEKCELELRQIADLLEATRPIRGVQFPPDRVAFYPGDWLKDYKASAVILSERLPASAFLIPSYQLDNIKQWDMSCIRKASEVVTTMEGVDLLAHTLERASEEISAPSPKIGPNPNRPLSALCLMLTQKGVGRVNEVKFRKIAGFSNLTHLRLATPSNFPVSSTGSFNEEEWGGAMEGLKKLRELSIEGWLSVLPSRPLRDGFLPSLQILGLRGITAQPLIRSLLEDRTGYLALLRLQGCQDEIAEEDAAFLAVAAEVRRNETSAAKQLCIGSLMTNDRDWREAINKHAVTSEHPVCTDLSGTNCVLKAPTYIKPSSVRVIGGHRGASWRQAAQDLAQAEEESQRSLSWDPNEDPSDALMELPRVVRKVSD